MYQPTTDSLPNSSTGSTPCETTEFTLGRGTAIVGGYRLQRPIEPLPGADRWSAVHPLTGLKRSVTIIDGELLRSHAVLDRWVSKVQRLVDVSIDGVVPVEAVGTVETHAGSRWYVVSNFSRGQTLDAWLASQQAQDLDKLILVAQATAELLARLEACDWAIADIHLGQLFVTNRADGNWPPDLSVAELALQVLREVLVDLADERALVLSDASCWSPQMCHRLGAAHPRCWVYAAGALVYRLICGRFPHAGSYRELCDAKVTAAPSIAPVLADRGFSGQALEGWTDVLSQALAREPLARFTDIRAFVEALRSTPLPRESSSCELKRDSNPRDSCLSGKRHRR